MKKLIIFDLDGTLLNTIGDLATATNYALRCHHHPEHPLSAYPYFVGNGVTRLIERALPENNRSEEHIQEVRKDFIHFYQIHKTDLTLPYPGIPELLNNLKSAGFRLAVASNKYHQGTAELIDHYFGSHFFDAVLGQREDVPVKPDPRIVCDLLAQTGSTPGESLYVGDSGVDMQTAANSGITSVGVIWGFRPRQELEENGACHIVTHPSEIEDLAASN